MIANRDFQDTATWLDQCHNPLLLSHRRADGDSLGSLAAMSLVLSRRACRPTVALFESLPKTYAFLRELAPWCHWEQVRAAPTGEYDGVVILDTCALGQLEPAADFLERAPRTLVIDHHLTRDPLGTRPGDLRLLDESAAATSVIIAEWIRAIDIPFDAQLATALFVGIATDCGWFRFTNTDARAMRLAAELLEAGAEPAGIYEAVYQQDPPAKLRLIARMLANLELKAGGKLAVMYLRASDFTAAGADPNTTSDLVNETARLAGIEATLLFTEQSDHCVRVNFRSKRTLDVAALAARFGGGGHARAAGARLKGDWNSVVPRVIAQTVAAL